MVLEKVVERLPLVQKYARKFGGRGEDEDVEFVRMALATIPSPISSV